MVVGTSAAADNNSADYQAADMAAARFVVVEREFADSLAAVAVAIAMVALAARLQTFAKQSYSGDIL